VCFIDCCLTFVVLSRYLNDNASVDAISSKLREVCPNLYRNEDAACSKVSYNIMYTHYKDWFVTQYFQVSLNVCGVLQEI
jgi:hypothetical protein